MFRLVKLVPYFIVPVIIGLATYFYLQDLFFHPRDANSTRTEIVQIQPEDTSEQICQLLLDRNIIRSAQSMCLFMSLRGISSFVPGEYELSPVLTLSEIIEKFQNGDRLLRTVRFAAGSSIKEIDAVLTKEEIISQFAFEQITRTPDLLARAGIAAGSFEGYLGFGDLTLSKPADLQALLWELLLRAESKWQKEYTEQLEALRMSRHEILTIASIIQKVTAEPRERRMVSAVLHNRLKLGLRLENFETLLYGSPNAEGLTAEQLKAVAGPYNTYMNYGLPPGPITNPDQDAIEAALFPLDADAVQYERDGERSIIFVSEETKNE